MFEYDVRRLGRLKLQSFVCVDGAQLAQLERSCQQLGVGEAEGHDFCSVSSHRFDLLPVPDSKAAESLVQRAGPAAGYL